MSHYYEILDIPLNASQLDIRSSFLSKAKQFHPDKRRKAVEQLFNPQTHEAHNVSGASDWDEMFSKLSLAYSILSDEVKRAQYDLQLLSAASTTPSSSKNNKNSKTSNTNKQHFANSLHTLRELQKKDAKLQFELMEETYKLKRAQEERKNGLVVLEAYYGSKHALENDNVIDSKHVIDITRQVQVLVDSKSRLILPAGQPKSQLIPGMFFDKTTMMDSECALKVVYLFKRKRHHILVDDEELLVAPVKAHATTLSTTYCEFMDEMKLHNGMELALPTPTTTATRRDLPTTRMRFSPLFLTIRFLTMTGVGCVVYNCV